MHLVQFFTPEREHRIRLWRGNEVIWESLFDSGEENMSHDLLSPEYHHFKYSDFWCPIDLCCHFYLVLRRSASRPMWRPVQETNSRISAECFGVPLSNTMATADTVMLNVKVL